MEWYQKASVQTAFVSGLFLVTVSLGGAVFSLYKENIELAREVDTKINSAILRFSENTLEASQKVSKIDLSPNFASFEGAIETLRNINKEAHTYSTLVNFTEIHRYVRKYGSEQTQKELGIHINAFADSHQALNSYVLQLLNNKNKPNSKNVSEYIKLLNSRSIARRDLESYITNLESKDFKI